MAKGAYKVPRNPSSCFIISCFTVSVTRSINTLEPFMIYIHIFLFLFLFILFTSSFQINKVISLPTLTALFLLIFLSNLVTVFETKLLTNPGKLSLAKGISRSASTFSLDYLTKNQKIHL